MKRLLRPVIERILRRLPVARVAYWERDALAARLRALETPLEGAADAALSAAAQVASLDPHRLEDLVPESRSMEERTLITLRCRDADVLPRAPHAGEVVRQADGTQVQIMHNGIKVLAGGYYGPWMQDLIARCKGHHEPQDEVLFAEMLRHVGDDATMVELGGFWSFYSIWFLTQGTRRRAFVVEADPAHVEVGRTNGRLNACDPVFVQATVGGRSAPPAPFATEESGVVDLPAVSVSDLMATHGVRHLDLLHCDAQGVELEVLESCLDLAAAGRIGWLMVSTHSHHISGDPLTHQRCLAVLIRAGATILAEHDVQESFSGDGLIVAKFGAVPAGWRTPKLTQNRYSESLFRNPLYDLAAANRQAATPAATASDAPPADPLAASGSLALRGGIAAITADCSLGRAGDTIALPFDKAMLPMIARDSGWALETQDFVQTHANPAQRYAVLDIGANIGLFTRQIALRLPNLARFLCVEAEPGNFRALRYNVASLGDRVTTWNLALADADGETRFFRDAGNFGNYSLNEDAMRGQAFDTVSVQRAATGRWMRDNVRLADDERLIWKSDTQGYDELIISLTPMELWQRIDVAVVELWRIRKPSFDQAEFARRMDDFPNRSIGVGNRSSTADILDYLSGDDWQFEDLYLWR
ncbi:MAG: FkbM family methyltransferase [Acetobacteraceae bacterium]